MKQIFYILTALSGIGMAMAAQEDVQPVVDGVSVSDLKMEHSGSHMIVDMQIDMQGLDVNSNRAVLLTPRIVNGGDSIDLPSVGIYGRRRYYYYVRNGESMLSDKDETSFKAKNKPADIVYHKIVEYADWMNGARLLLCRRDYGCCNTLLAEQSGQLGEHDEAFFPELVFVQPKAKLDKTRSLSGSAYIDFPVDQTTIYPDYHDNTAELGKIERTIDSVRNDKDVTITSVWLKGYASPESPYKHNAELAIGRTAALKTHVGRLFHFADSTIVTDYEPENWEGLRKYVEKSNLDHREEILAMIDSDMDPDAKEAKIKSTYPKEYRFLLKHCYPYLRRTDYRIEYNIRSYNDVDEIKRMLAEKPGNLDQNELYLVAGTYEPGTPEFTDVFETAARMFPTDSVANLNAANAAIRRDDFASAIKYLDKAGDSPEAVYARGALAIRQKDYEAARRYLEQAKKLGLKQAEQTLEELNRANK